MLPPSERGLPPIVGWVLLALVVAHLARILAPADAQIWAVRTFAVHPVRYDPANAEGFSSLWGPVLQLAGSAMIHLNWLHLLLNAACVLQAGVPVARGLGEGRSGGGRFLLVFFGSGVAGSLAYVALNWGSPVEAFGASGAACGVFGAYFLTARGGWRASLADPQIRAGVAVFLGINVVLVGALRVFGLLPIAWEAHLGGFLAGAVLAVLLRRPAIS
jgi:membrane associated rhomboid family serine protease